jgi:type III pantothenate kinase
MSTRFLSVDLGNSRCKLRLWRVHAQVPAELLASLDLDTDGPLAARVRTWLGVQPAADAAGVSCVASAALEAELVQALVEGGIAAVDARPDPGLVISRVAHPERIGRDRLFAARGALESVRASALVVDAGTALTVDALRVDPITGRGEFLGGAIAPGPRLLATALASGTANLPRVDPIPGVRALGQDTQAALQAGVVVGFEGAARELVLRIGAEAGMPQAPVLLTGGAREFLVNSSSFARGLRVIEEPELVARGLVAAFAAQLNSSDPKCSK